MPHTNGSEWRRWDLHVHTKGTLKEDNFKSESFEVFCSNLFQAALENEIAAIGITDYFSIENFLKTRQFVEEIETNEVFSSDQKQNIKNILLIPNVELRMLPTTDSGRLINIHCLFNPDFVDSLENHFFNSLEHSGGNGIKYLMNRQGMVDLGKSNDPGLDGAAAYKKGVSLFAVGYGDIQKLKDSDKDFRENVIIAVSNSSNDGTSGLQKHFDIFEGVNTSSLDAVRKAIYTISDCIFSGNPKDVEYFSGKGVDNKQSVVLKCGSLKPCIHGSDAHTEEKLFNPDNNRYCWVKADPTFNGLRQIIYEPFAGDRVWIGQARPDQKDDYKIIKNIKFRDTDDFQQEIKFNPNLCSIIGSRSVGKSALLAYLADSIDTTQAREKKPYGPGEGYPWTDVKFGYSVEWANGLTNGISQGKVVYIPQNYLYEMSGKPEEIKNKILPVLNKKYPRINSKYKIVERDIIDINNDIRKAVKKWFKGKKEIDEISDALNELGSKKAVLAEKEKKDNEIIVIKKKYKLKSAEVKKLQELSELISTLEQKQSKLSDELKLIGEEGKNGNYFKKSDVALTPSEGDLPDSLREKINKELEKSSKKIVSEVNKIVISYSQALDKELQGIEEQLTNKSKELKTLKEKQAKNEQLESLIEKTNELTSTLLEIENNFTKTTKADKKLKKINREIHEFFKIRSQLITDFEEELLIVDQDKINEIVFGIEAKIDGQDKEDLQQKINTKENTDFVSSHKLNFDEIRSNPTLFLDALYSKDQKVNQGHESESVGIEALTLTERVLFNAQMEGDKIGGFSDPTMTPGKRALFALRLILEESDDTWPLLIDQPEDDLDSRSIYDDIVPFLKKKKRERQIIMVSHNANLVIGSDSEQIIIANRHGEDRINEDGYKFNYWSGGIENTSTFNPKCKDTLKSQGVREHACQILEGGELAFKQRSNRYNIEIRRSKS